MLAGLCTELVDGVSDHDKFDVVVRKEEGKLRESA